MFRYPVLPKITIASIIVVTLGSCGHAVGPQLPPTQMAQSASLEKVGAASLIGFVEYPVPTAGSDLGDITLGGDGNIWFAELGAGKIGRITPSGRVTEFGRGIPGPHRIMAGPDRTLWFVTGSCPPIGRCSGLGFGRITTDGAITLFPSAACASPQSITLGPDSNLWMLLIKRSATIPGFCVPGGSEAVLKMNSAGKTIASFQNSNFDFPFGSEIVSGPDKNLWIAQYDSIARMTTSGVVSVFPVPNGAAFGITVGPPANQRLWLQENFAIGEMTTSGAVKQFADPDAPVALAAGADGNIWFTDSFSEDIGRITPSGAITRFTLPPNRGPTDITAGPGRTMWFTETTANKIAKFVP